MDTFANQNECKKITVLEAANIVQHKRPLGLFYCSTDQADDWIALDNSGGNAFVHECNSRRECIDWLTADSSREEDEHDKVK